MKTIICLGSRACDIGEKFENNKNYIVKLIDKDIEGDNCFALKQEKTPEEYEKNTPDFKSFFSDISNNILFTVSGDSDVVSCSLKILEQIKDKQITILFLYPDIDFLNNNNILQNKIAFKVLQEYARSGLFKEIILIDEKAVESSLGDVPVTQVYDSYINLIYNTIDSLTNLETTDAVLKHENLPSELSRIVTYGYYDLENDLEKLFFNLNLIENKCYNFVINEQSLKTDNSLYKNIKQNIKAKAIDNTKISYTIHATNSKQNYCYIKAYTKLIQ